MITSAKCRNLGEDHIVRRVALHLNENAGDKATVLPTADDQFVLNENKKNKPGSLTAEQDVPVRFHKNGRTLSQINAPLLWISGFDIIATFHMKAHHLERWGVNPFDLSYRGSNKSRLRRYFLHQVYDAAVRTSGRPIHETPDAALDRYLDKVKRCGLHPCCPCYPCDDLRAGTRREGEGFGVRTLYTDVLEDERKDQERSATRR
jgi:hypothetical protein